MVMWVWLLDGQNPGHTPSLWERTMETVFTPTFSIHAKHSVRAEPLTVHLLLQVKHPPPINLLIRDAIVMVTLLVTSTLERRTK